VPANVPEKHAFPGGRGKPAAPWDLFSDHDAHPIILSAVLFTHFGAQWFTWVPETLWKEIIEDFGLKTLTDHTRSKIQAVRTIHITDWCWTKWEVFCPIVQALNNNIPDFEIMRKPTISQLFFTADVMGVLRDDVDWGEEVCGFVAASLLTKSVTYAPDPISFCQNALDECLVEMKLGSQAQDVKTLYNLWKDKPLEEVEIRENAAGVQTARLLVARQYLLMRRSQMESQMRRINGPGPSTSLRR